MLLTVLLRLSNVRRPDQISIYRKIPKISHAHGAYIFQRPFLRGLFLEGLIFGGAYVRREICDSKSIGLACSGREIYHFCFVLLCIRGQIPSTSPLGGLYSEGRFNRGFFALRFSGAYTWRGLFSEFYGIFLLFEILLYLESYSVFFLDRLLEYTHGVLCYCFFGYKKICFHLLFRSKQGLPSETTCSFSG